MRKVLQTNENPRFGSTKVQIGGDPNISIIINLNKFIFLKLYNNQ